jgi:PAS domain S-box-containing protein
MESIKLDFEQARAKHLLFKSRLRAILYGIDIDEAPVLSQYECNVGKWIYSHALKEYGHIPEMQQLEKIHADIHISAKKLVALYKEGKVDQARNGLSEMEGVADKLVGLLTVLESKLQEQEADSVDEEKHLGIKLDEFEDILKANIELDKRIKEQVTITEATNRLLEKKAGEAEVARRTLHDFFMQTPAVLAILKGPEHVFELANQDYLELVGNRDVLGKTVREALPDIEGQGFYELLDEVYTTGKSFTGKAVPAKLERNGGFEEIFLDLMYQAFKDENDKIQGILVFAYDVTEQVISKNELEKNEAKAKFITESMPQKVWTADADGNVNYVNDQWLDYSGLKYEDLKDWGWVKLVHPDDLDSTRKSWQHSLDTGDNFELEHRFLREDGEYRWHLSRACAQKDKDGKVYIWIGTNTDVEDQKKNEAALKESEKRFSSLADNISQFAWMANADGYLFWYNNRWFDYTGTTLEEMQGWGWSKVHHPDFLEKVTEKWTKYYNAGVEWEDTFPLRGKDGKYRWFLSRAIPIKNKKGEVVRWFGTNTDIDDQKKTEEALRESELRLKQSYDDLETKVTFRNLELERLNRANETKINELQKELELLQEKK